MPLGSAAPLRLRSFYGRVHNPACKLSLSASRLRMHCRLADMIALQVAAVLDTACRRCCSNHGSQSAEMPTPNAVGTKCTREGLLLLLQKRLLQLRCEVVLEREDNIEKSIDFILQRSRVFNIRVLFHAHGRRRGGTRGANHWTPIHRRKPLRIP